MQTTLVQAGRMATVDVRALGDSVRGTELALGFRAAMSSDDAVWGPLSLQLWRGRSEIRTCPCAPFREVVVGLHTGGVNLRGQVEGRWIDRVSRPGHVTITPPGTPITWDVAGELQSCTLHIPPERFDNLVPDADGESLLREVRFEFATDDALLSASMASLARELQEPTERGPLYIETLADAVAFHLLQRRSRERASAVPCGALSRRALSAVVECIETSLSTGISLEALARAASLSRSHLCRAFRASTGCSPQQYLRRRRIERVRQFLLSEKISIAQIAADCGFASQAHLTDCFKSATGLTPFAFRRSRSGASEP